MVSMTVTGSNPGTTTIEQLDAHLTALQTQITALAAGAITSAERAKITELDGEVTALQAQVTALAAGAITAAERAKIAELDGEVTVLQSQVASLQSTAAATSAALTALDQREAASTAQIGNRVTTLESRVGGLTGGFTYRGTWDASGGLFPASAASGDLWRIVTGGTLGGVAYLPGDSLIALRDTPSAPVTWTRAPGDGDVADLVDTLRDEVGAVADYVTPRRVYVAAGGSYFVQSSDAGGGLLFFDFNGTINIDVSGLRIADRLTIVLRDYGNGRANIVAGVGAVFNGTSDRDGFSPESQAVLLRGGEAMTITKLAGNRFAVLSGTFNQDLIRLAPVSAYERIDGRYDLHQVRSYNPGSSTVTFAISGKNFNLSTGKPGGLVMRANDPAAPLDALQIVSINTDNTAVIYNPNAVAVTADLWFLDVENT